MPARPAAPARPSTVHEEEHISQPFHPMSPGYFPYWLLFMHHNDTPAAPSTCQTVRQDEGPREQCRGCSSACGAGLSVVVVVLTSLLIWRKVRRS